MDNDNRELVLKTGPDGLDLHPPVEELEIELFLMEPPPTTASIPVLLTGTRLQIAKAPQVKLEAPTLKPRSVYSLPKRRGAPVSAGAHLASQTEWLVARDVAVRSAGVPALSHRMSAGTRAATDTAVLLAAAAVGLLASAWVALGGSLW